MDKQNHYVRLRELSVGLIVGKKEWYTSDLTGRLEAERRAGWCWTGEKELKQGGFG